MIGVTDPRLGHAIKAFTVPRENANVTEQQIQNQRKRRLEDFMVPKFVEFKDTLPKNTSGKIDRRQLD